MSAVTTRPASQADIPGVRRVLVETWHATYDPLFGAERVTAITDDWHSEPRLRQGLERTDHRFLVAEADGDLVGTASATLKPHGVLRLDRLYVRPALQGRGIGTALLAAALTGWPAVRRIDLEVEPRNAPAIAFYRRHGFVPVPSPASGCVEKHLAMYRHLPPTGFSIRRGEPDEAGAIHVVVTQSIAQTNSRDYGSEAIAFMLGETTQAAIAAQLAQWDVFVVTDREGTVCGTGSFDGTRVRKLFVSPGAQGKGLGAVLMDAIEDSALAAGLGRLAVRASLTAVPFYESRGFVARESTAWGPAPMVVMERLFPSA